MHIDRQLAQPFADRIRQALVDAGELSTQLVRFFPFPESGFVSRQRARADQRIAASSMGTWRSSFIARRERAQQWRDFSVAQAA